jgi:7,8-dihydro-6-hydroxymethylpterin-pyrophosphokinase
MVRVIVEQWCTLPGSKACLEHILNNTREIEAAAKTLPYTSPPLTPTDAATFRNCVVACGGRAKIREV